MNILLYVGVALLFVWEKRVNRLREIEFMQVG